MRRIVIVALMLSLTSFIAAAAKNSQTVILGSSVQVNSVTLPAGDYKVTWTGTAPNVTVTLSRPGMTPVTMQARLVQEKHSFNSVSVKSAAGGTQELESILLRDVSLIFSAGTASGN